MKIWKFAIFFLSLFITFESIAQNEFVRADFRCADGRYFLTNTTLHLPKICLKVHLRQDDHNNTLSDYYWEGQNCIYKFTYIGSDLYFMRYCPKRDFVFWAVFVERCKITMLK